MDRERLAGIVDSLTLGGDGPVLTRLSRLCAEELAVEGAGITLFVGDRPWGPSGSSDAISARIEELQLTIGEGPCADAHRGGRPVAEPDLERPRRARWPGLSEPALAAGAAALFAFPLRVGGAHLGALTLYRSHPGPLSSDQHEDGLVMAEVATNAILAVQADVPTDGGEVGAELIADYRASLHQAAGMVSVQLEVSVLDAMVRLRARAYASGRPLAEVSDAVVARRLRLDRDPPEWETDAEDDEEVRR